jgi:hypothetical protein
MKTLVAVRKNRDAKAELNRRSQACAVLTVTGIRAAEKVERGRLPFAARPNVNESW